MDLVQAAELSKATHFPDVTSVYINALNWEEAVNAELAM